MRAGQEEVDNLSRELRYTQQTVAMELAGWQDMHERMGRKAIRELARGMVVAEKLRLAGMQRALRKLREVPAGFAAATHAGGALEAGEEAAGFSMLNPPIALAGLEMAASREGDRDADLPVSTASAKAPPPPKEIFEDLSDSGPSVQIANGSPALEPPRLPQPRRDDVFGDDERAV